MSEWVNGFKHRADSKWHHQHKMTAPVSGTLWLYYEHLGEIRCHPSLFSVTDLDFYIKLIQFFSVKDHNTTELWKYYKKSIPLCNVCIEYLSIFCVVWMFSGWIIIFKLCFDCLSRCSSRTPAMIGCSFVVDREYFGEIGLLDPGMEVYGGENIELGMRVRTTDYYPKCIQIGRKLW